MKSIVKILIGAVLVSSFNLVLSQDVGVTVFISPTSGQMVYPNDSILVELNISNMGTTIVGMNDYDSLPVSLYANGKLVAKSFFSGQWTVGQVYSIALNTMRNFETWGDHNIDSGVVNICAKTFIWKNGVNIDVDQSNDELCLPTIIYIGPKGTGIEDKHGIANNIYYSHGQLYVEFSEIFKGGVQISVIDISGRVLYVTELVASDQKLEFVSIPNLSTGTYIAQIVTSSGERGSIKFFVQ